jgi:hypothetical protein
MLEATDLACDFIVEMNSAPGDCIGPSYDAFIAYEAAVANKILLSHDRRMPFDSNSHYHDLPIDM